MTNNSGPKAFIMFEKWELTYLLSHLPEGHSTVKEKLEESYDNLC